MSKSKDITYNSWCSMRNRCTPQYHQRRYYLDKGITVCHEWEISFQTFYFDMGPRPSLNYSIDRIDNKKGYYPGNCRWATKSQQQQNSSQTRNITHNGQTKCLSVWAKNHGISPQLLSERLKLGWSMDKSLNTPTGGSPETAVVRFSPR